MIRSPRAWFTVLALVAVVGALDVAVRLPYGLRPRAIERVLDADVDAFAPTYANGAARFRRRQLEDRFGQIPANALMRAKGHLDRMRERARGRRGGLAGPQAAPANATAPGAAVGGSATAAVSLGQDGWRWLGPDNVGGRIRSLVIDPARRTTMFAGSVGGGIWKTTDGGAHWAPVDDFMAVLSVASIVMNPADPSIMYAGTGEGYNNIDAIRGAGVFKSVDGGATWAQLAATSTAPEFWYVNRLAIAPDGRTLLVASAAGLFRSTDGGASFARAPIQIDGQDVAFHPTDSAKAILAGAGRVAYSRDGGATWTPATGLPASSARIEVAYARSQPAIVYASVDVGGGSVYRSVDGGASFSFVANPPARILGTQGWYGNAIWIDPTASSHVIVGGVNLFESTDSGQSWRQISNTGGRLAIHVDQHVIVEDPAFDGTGNRTVYFCNDGGVYRVPDLSTVDTTGYERLDAGLGVTQFYAADGEAPGGTLVGGTQDNGTLRHTLQDGTSSWTTVAGGDGGFTAVDRTDAHYLYGEMIYLQLFRSATGGASASFIYGGIADAGSEANFIAPLVLDPNDQRRLFAGGNHLWRTDDARASAPAWRSIKAAAPGGDDYISAIAVAPGNSNLVWVGHDSGAVYRSASATMATPAWTRVAAPTGAMVTRIAIDPFDVGTVYVTTGGFAGNNVLKTIDGGATWTVATGSGDTALPAAPVYDLQYAPADPDTIYAAGELGVFTSRDGGGTWELPQDGPANVCVEQLFWLDSTLVAVTHGRGLFAFDTAGPPAAGPADDVPAPWSAEDIGQVGVAGRASAAAGVFTVSGAGADVWGTADAFRFVHQPLTGNGSIVARVVAVQNAAAWTKAGVMMRASLDPSAAQAFMLVSAGKGLAFQRRTVTGGTSTNTSGGAAAAPYFVKLTRAGNVITASVSPDGTSWTTVGQETIGLPATIEIGLAVSSHDATRTATATFDQVAVAAGGAALPSGWQTADVGLVGTAGSASQNGGTFIVAGAGADVWGTADAFRYAYCRLAGDGTIVARVATVAGVAAWTKAGVMIRQSLDPGSPHGFVLVSVGKGLAFQRRPLAGGPSIHTSGGSGTAPRWVKLVRTGQTLAAFVSSDGSAWTAVGTETVALSGAVWAGLAVSSHDAGAVATATFDHVAVTAAGALPAGWHDADVGSVGLRGAATASGGTFTVDGAGDDIWNTADAFHFASRTLAGDGQLVARVVSLDPIAPWSKAGVMVRHTLDPGSAYALMLVSASRGTAFQYRPSAGNAAVHVGGPTAAAPAWVKIVRTGSTITASESADGATWRVVGSASIPMAGSIEIGLAVTSHDNAALCRATFDHVSP